MSKIILNPKGAKGLLGSLRRFGKLKDAMTYVPATGREPEHFLVHGRIEADGVSSDMYTAITPGTEGTDLSSTIGQMPDTFAGAAVRERLEHRLGGTFLRFDAEDRGMADVVYVTNKPTNYLNEATLGHELERHADVKITVEPILHACSGHSTGSGRSTYPKLSDAADDLIEANLGLRNALRDSSTTPKYTLIIPPRTKKK